MDKKLANEFKEAVSKTLDAINRFVEFYVSDKYGKEYVGEVNFYLGEDFYDLRNSSLLYAFTFGKYAVMSFNANNMNRVDNSYLFHAKPLIDNKNSEKMGIRGIEKDENSKLKDYLEDKNGNFNKKHFDKIIDKIKNNKTKKFTESNIENYIAKDVKNVMEKYFSKNSDLINEIRSINHEIQSNIIPEYIEKEKRVKKIIQNNVENKKIMQNKTATQEKQEKEEDYPQYIDGSSMY